MLLGFAGALPAFAVSWVFRVKILQFLVLPTIYALASDFQVQSGPPTRSSRVLVHPDWSSPWMFWKAALAGGLVLPPPGPLTKPLATPPSSEVGRAAARPSAALSGSSLVAPRGSIPWVCRLSAPIVGIYHTAVGRRRAGRALGSHSNTRRAGQSLRPPRTAGRPQAKDAFTRLYEAANVLVKVAHLITARGGFRPIWPRPRRLRNLEYTLLRERCGGDAQGATVLRRQRARARQLPSSGQARAPDWFHGRPLGRGRGRGRGRAMQKTYERSRRLGRALRGRTHR